MKNGLFITLYGINNIGKSTHAKRLVEHLKKEGFDAVYLKYPIYDLEPTGPKINSILRGGSGENDVSNGNANEPGNRQMMSEEQLQTLFAQNRRDFEPQLQNILAQGKVVVAEDYTGTGMAWGMAKGLSREALERINADLLAEDFSLLLVGERAMKSKEEGHIHESNDALVEQVSAILKQLGAEKGWHTVELQPEKEDTAKLIWQLVRDFLEKCA